MQKYSYENDNIIRITTPFSDIFTTVYIIKTQAGVLVFDTASYDSDIDDYIVPVLAENGISGDDIKYVFISHEHGDHAGGLRRFLEKYPNVCIVSSSAALKEEFCGYSYILPSDGEMILGTLEIVTIPGHTEDGCAILDKRTNTLITGDCLQCFGVYGPGAWATNVCYPAAYFDALDKISKMQIDTILGAHDYHPCGYKACGHDEVEKYITVCRDAVTKIRNLIFEKISEDDAQIAAIFAEEGLPRLASSVVTAIRREINEGQF